MFSCSAVDLCSFCSQSQLYILLVLQVNDPVNSCSKENNMRPGTLGKPEADMTQIQCCLLTCEVFEFVSVWLHSLVVDDYLPPPQKTQCIIIQSAPHSILNILWALHIEKRQDCFCRLIFSDMSLYPSHRTSTFCKEKKNSRILMHHGNGEGVWKICGKKSEQIWFHSKCRMMNASCNLELQEISNPVLYSCAVL